MIASIALAALLATAPDSVRPRVVVCGFDISGSMFSLWRDARSVCEVELMTARSGDMVIIRAIGAYGYLPTAEIVRVKFPPAASSCSTFDTRCRAASARAQGALVQRRRAACVIVHQWVAVKAEATDLLGFVQAASDEFAIRPGAARRLVVATDLDETVSQQLRADLAGTEVNIVLLRTSNSVAEAQRAKQRWLDRLSQLKAAPVSLSTRASGPRCS